MIVNKKEVEKILKENNLQWDIIEKFIQRIDEILEYKYYDCIISHIYKDFMITIKRYIKFYNKQGQEISINLENFEYIVIEDTIISLKSIDK